MVLEKTLESPLNCNEIQAVHPKKLLTEEEKAKAKKSGSHPIYLPSHLPEYKEISELYFSEERKISEYQVQCKDKAIEMFSKWFYSLWI